MKKLFTGLSIGVVMLILACLPPALSGCSTDPTSSDMEVYAPERLATVQCPSGYVCFVTQQAADGKIIVKVYLKKVKHKIKFTMHLMPEVTVEDLTDSN